MAHFQGTAITTATGLRSSSATTGPKRFTTSSVSPPHVSRFGSFVRFRVWYSLVSSFCSTIASLTILWSYIYSYEWKKNIFLETRVVILLIYYMCWMWSRTLSMLRVPDFRRRRTFYVEAASFGGQVFSKLKHLIFFIFSALQLKGIVSATTVTNC